MTVHLDPIEPPRGALRLAFRAPAWLFRARLGFVLGPRIVMLEHIGRATGARRYSCVEVVERLPGGGWIIVSGYGERSQWYRNLAAHSEIHLWTGTRRIAVAAELLAPEAGAPIMVDYARRNPKLAPKLMRLCGARIDGSDDDYREVAVARLRFVRLVPR